MRDGKPRWLVIAEGLAGKALQRYGVDEVVVHGRATGAVLEGLLLAHPFYAEREIPLILADHVSAAAGTGAVHTSPGHGPERTHVVMGKRVYVTVEIRVRRIINKKNTLIPNTHPLKP